MKPSVTLKENYEFRRLYQKGASAVGGCMVIYCRRNRLGRNRLGITVSVKIGNAVKRNRARRRLREVFRLNSPCLRQGWDMVLVARGRTLTAPWKELNDTFLRLCRKLELLQDRQGPQNTQAKNERQERQEKRGTKKEQTDGQNKQKKQNEQNEQNKGKISVKRDRPHAPEKMSGAAEDKP